MSFPADVPGGQGPWPPIGARVPEPFDPSRLPPIPRKFQHRVRLHVLLFIATLATTTLAGSIHYYSFVSDIGRLTVPLNWTLLAGGLWYSLTVLAILGAHELGHYFACRWHNVDATLPFFLPLLIPLPIFQTGTLGAVIRIREPFPTRSVLFDIGVAGPLAGFAILVPALFIGLSMSRLVPIPTGVELLFLGKPLLHQAAVKMMFGAVPDGHMVSLHPMVFGCWFGMLATALNLLPFGQLDGGHITYAVLKRFSSPISLVTVAGAVAMTWFSSSYVVLTLMMIAMLVFLGSRHPRVLYENEPVSTGRLAVAFLALIILIICFTPFPIKELASASQG